MGALDLLNKPCKSWLAGQKLLLHFSCTARLQCEAYGVKSHSYNPGDCVAAGIQCTLVYMLLLHIKQTGCVPVYEILGNCVTIH